MHNTLVGTLGSTVDKIRGFSFALIFCFAIPFMTFTSPSIAAEAPADTHLSVAVDASDDPSTSIAATAFDDLYPSVGTEAIDDVYLSAPSETLDSAYLSAVSEALDDSYPLSGAEALDDPYLWLEDVDGDAALAWVQEQNERTLAYVQRHRELYESLYARLLPTFTSDERIPYPGLAGDYVYNSWTDEAHPRGLWRRTPLESYVAGEPLWEDLLDVTVLADTEGVNWTFDGASCLPPAYERCLVFLSRGGSDTVEVREFDVPSRAFVPGGFFLPEAKTDAVWVDENSLLVAADWGEGTLTTSGYPYIVKRLERGMQLSEAVTVFEGDPDDVGAMVTVTSFRNERIPVVIQGEDFYDQTYYLVWGDELVRLDVPSDADWLLVADQLVIRLRSDWHVGDTAYLQGSVIVTEFEAFLHGERKFQPVFVPTDRVVVHEMEATADFLLISVLNNVSSELYRFRYDRGTGSDQSAQREGSGDGSSPKHGSGSTAGASNASAATAGASNPGTANAGATTAGASDAGTTRVGATNAGAINAGVWTAEEVSIPELGGVELVSASRSDNRAFFEYSNYLQPSTLYLLENDGSIRPVAQLPDMFEREGLVVEQYEATSPDGTAVPYFVVRRKDLLFDGSNPTLLYGYGGFEESLIPEYWPSAGVA